MMQERKQMIKAIVSSLRRLLQSVYNDNEKMSRQYGVTGPQGGVLRSLRDEGPASSAQLSRSLFVTPSTMTGLIDRLEKKKLVVRTPKPGDRRVSIINLTPAGQALSLRLPDPLELRMAAKLADLDTEHVMQINGIVKELLAIVEVGATEDAVSNAI